MKEVHIWPVAMSSGQVYICRSYPFSEGHTIGSWSQEQKSMSVWTLSALNFEYLGLERSFSVGWHILYLRHVRILRSSGLDQGHRIKKFDHTSVTVP